MKTLYLITNLWGTSKHQRCDKNGEDIAVTNLRKTVTSLRKESILEKEFLSVITRVCWKKVIEETNKLMNEWLHDSPLKDIAFKAIMIMSSLLLQKPSQKSKPREHLKASERRINL